MKRKKENPEAIEQNRDYKRAKIARSLGCFGGGAGATIAYTVPKAIAMCGLAIPAGAVMFVAGGILLGYAIEEGCYRYHVSLSKDEQELIKTLKEDLDDERAKAQKDRDDFRATLSSFAFFKASANDSELPKSTKQARDFSIVSKNLIRGKN